MKLAAATLLIIVGAHGGCTSTTSQVGVRVGDNTLNQFEAGTTTESWMFAILGPPTTTRDVEGIPNTRVHRYVTRDSNTGLATIFSGQGSRDTAVVYFIATDGIITRYWADRTEAPVALPPDAPEKAKPQEPEPPAASPPAKTGSLESKAAR